MGKRNTKIAVLFSGGFDSGVVYYKTKHLKADYVFFNYNQIYVGQEFKHADLFLAKEKKQLKMLRDPWGAHDMPGRNFRFLTQLKAEGYTDVYMGTRCPLPMFDKFGDANYFSLKLRAKKIGIRVHMPIMCWTKTMVFKYLKKRTYLERFYNCYNNRLDYFKCKCVNCIERVRFVRKH